MSRLMQRLTRLEERYPPAMAPAGVTLGDVLDAILGDQPDQAHRASFIDLVRDMDALAGRQVQEMQAGHNDPPLSPTDALLLARFEALVAEKGAALGYEGYEGQGHAWT